jgi:hypothetical protein
LEADFSADFNVRVIANKIKLLYRNRCLLSTLAMTKGERPRRLG